MCAFWRELQHKNGRGSPFFFFFNFESAFIEGLSILLIVNWETLPFCIWHNKGPFIPEALNEG